MTHLADHGLRVGYLASPRPPGATVEDVAKDPTARWVHLYPEFVEEKFKDVRPPEMSVRAENAVGREYWVIAINTGEPVLIYRNDKGDLDGAVITVPPGREWAETVKRWLEAGQVVA